MCDGDRVKIAQALLVTFLTACGATNGGARFDLTPAPAAPEVSTARASSPEVGVVSLISDAIANLNLSQDQNNQLSALVHQVDERHHNVQDQRKQLSLDMASAVETGNVDEKALMADAKNLGQQRAEFAAADGQALEELHRILTPEQRKRFADGVRARAEKLPTDDAQTRYGNWRSDLDISLEQNEKISPKLDAATDIGRSAQAEREAWQKRLRAMADDFEHDTFSAKSYLDPDVVGTTVERVRRVVAFLKIVVPVLTPKQQQVAATNLRAEVGEGKPQ